VGSRYKLRLGSEIPEFTVVMKALGFLHLLPAGLLLFNTPVFANLSGSEPADTRPDGVSQYVHIDRHVLNTPRQQTRSIKHLVPYLIKPARSEREKARAIYRWITENIAYDTKSYFSGRYRNRAVKTAHVLKRRRGVCDAYSRLFIDMAAIAGLKAVKISGYAKGFGYQAGDADSNENHAWNAVRIDGEWYLVDATWGAGTIDRKSKRFKKRFREFYFLSEPQQFIFSHYPKEQRWQLLERPKSFTDFNRTVYLNSEFFEHGLRLDSHNEAVIRTNEQLNLSLYVPEQSEITAYLYLTDTPLDRHQFYWTQARGKTAISAVFPQEGEYRLQVFTKDRKLDSSFTRALEYKIVAQRGSQKTFPMFHDAYFDSGIQVDSHPEGVIYTNGRLEMSLKVPPGIKISAQLQQDRQVLSRDQVFLQREGDRYRIYSLFPQAGEYVLHFFSQAAQNNSPKISTLEYTVVAQTGDGRVRFPTRYKKYTEQDVFLYSPIDNQLASGQPELFKIRVPEAVEVAVTIGDQWYFLEQAGNVFSGYVPIGEGEIAIVARFDKSKAKYSSLLKYKGI